MEEAAQQDPDGAYRPYLAAFAVGNAEDVEPEKTANIVDKMLGSGSFSWVTLFLGPFYWIYRRCYAEAAVYLGCLMAMSLLGILLGVRIGTLGAAIVAGFLFFPLYHKRAMRAYSDAYAAHPGSEQGMLGAMRNAGGTNLLGFWVAILCYAAAVLLIAWFVVGVLGVHLESGR